MTDDEDLRLEKIENAVAGVKSDMSDIKTFYADMVQKNHEMMTTIANSFNSAITYQANSLSIPLLKDVLVPMVMRLFTFFAVLVLGLLGTVLGIKWVATSLLKIPM